jgi:hypothetical protein
MWMVRALIGLHRTDTASDWLLIKRHCIGTKGLPGVQLQNYVSYRRDFSIYQKNMFYFNKKSEVPPKNSKTSGGPY